MNLVKKSLYLCIGVLLGLVALQAALSLWRCLACPVRPRPSS
jgi:hypothetical protein